MTNRPRSLGHFAPYFPAATLALALIGTTLSGCGLVYTDVHVPRAYRSATPSDVKPAAADETVTGSACNQSVLFLVAWGDGGYAAATRSALEGRAGLVLYDVKTDMRASSYAFGLYTKVCTVVTGKAGRL